MITSILSRLNFAGLQGGGEGIAGIGNLSDLLSIFNMEEMIPPYFLQISVGLYIIQIIFILSGTLVMIDSGEDKLEKINKTGKNLIRGVFLYFCVGLISTIALFLLTSVVIGGLVQ